MINIISIIEKEVIEVSIHNNGPIKTEDFEPILINLSISDQNVKKPIGSGLGLAICKQIIEHHKGTFG
jgi:signal transduction histidine kinase